MPGCYGNDPEDRARERELNAYLEATAPDDDAEEEIEAPDAQDWADYVRDFRRDIRMEAEAPEREGKA